MNYEIFSIHIEMDSFFWHCQLSEIVPKIHIDASIHPPYIPKRVVLLAQPSPYESKSN